MMGATDMRVPPVLSMRTLDYIDAEYTAKCEVLDGGGVITLHHRISAPCLVTSMIRDGDAQFAMEICAPASLSRRTDLADRASLLWEDSGGVRLKHSIKRSSNDEAAPVHVRGIVAAVRDASILCAAEHGVSDAWVGRRLHMAPGDVLAETSFTKNTVQTTSLLKVRNTGDAKSPADGEAQIKLDSGVFFLDVNPDTYRKYMDVRDDILRHTLHLNGLVAAMGLLRQRHADNDLGEDGCGESDNLKALMKRLKREGVDDWTAEEFDPMQAATRLKPMMLPEEADDGE